MKTLMLCLLLAGCAKHGDDGRTADQRKEAAKTDESAKRGALQKRADPAVDLERQTANLKRLEKNAEEDRKNGNRLGAWAAEQDAKSTQKIIAKDRAHED